MSPEYLALIEEIDACDHEVTTWEANFIEDILDRKPSYLSERQKAIIERMAKQYLGIDLN